MFTKALTALCSALVLVTVIGSVAQAQSGSRQVVQPNSDFEKLWFAIPTGPRGGD